MRDTFLVGVSFICARPCIMDEESICGTQGIIMGCDLVPYDWIFVIVEGARDKEVRVRSLCHGDPVTDELDVLKVPPVAPSILPPSVLYY